MEGGAEPGSFGPVWAGRSNSERDLCPSSVPGRAPAFPAPSSLRRVFPAPDGAGRFSSEDPLLLVNQQR